MFDNHHEAIAGLFPDLDHATVATAAPTLVYASSAAALDLCVSALAFWCDRPLGKDGREYDLGEMTTKDGRARQREWVPGWAQQWLDTTIPGQAKHVEFRDRQIHRVQSRSATVGAGGRRQVLAPHNSPDEPTVQERFEAAVRFTSERWQQFWLAVDGE